jgi:hypothetical protein
MINAVDHLVYTVPDLDVGIAAIEGLFGCGVVPGGRHEAWGTRNALVSLGETCYMEIIGPDPDAAIEGDPVLFGIGSRAHPWLATWAAKSDDLDATIERAKAVGVELGDVFPGSRQAPDGATLTWRLTDPFTERLDGVVPFFIDWGHSTHPAAMIPPACELIGLSIAHPDAVRVGSVLDALGVRVEVVVADRVAIVATIRTPNGVIDLS